MFHRLRDCGDSLSQPALFQYGGSFSQLNVWSQCQTCLKFAVIALARTVSPYQQD